MALVTALLVRRRRRRRVSDTIMLELLSDNNGDPKTLDCDKPGATAG